MGDATNRPEKRRDIELLTSINAVGSDAEAGTRCFGNILELGVDSMLVESHRIQTAGSALELRVVFPGQPSRANKVAKFQCVVRRVRDRARLHYDLVIEDMSDNARERLLEYLSSPPLAGGSEWT